MIFGKSEPKAPPTGNRATEGTTVAPAVAAPGAAAPAKGQAAPAPAQAAPAPAAHGERPAAKLRYVDRPDVAETFADSVTGLIFDGQTLRIEFAVTRIDEVKPGAPITGRRYPACRVVLPPAAAVDLINRMQQIAAALTQAGVTKTTPRAGGKPQAS